MKLLDMTSNRIRRCGEKENRAINGHLRNCFSTVAPAKQGSKFIRGMTEHPNIDKSQLQHLYTQPPAAHKRPLTSPNASFKHPHYDLSPSSRTAGDIQSRVNELTESNLRENVQIVLNNLNRSALRNYLNERLSKNFGGKMLSSPESDCNSNPHIGGALLSCSIASSQDFTHDNSDYQWFIDYGYRDGVTHQSILSSLSASYNGIGELSFYEDLAKNIDANLAEVDIESFTFRKDSTKAPPEFDLDNSICKSKQLFSPVKETNLSVDSLDLDCYGNDGDIILTCQANKDNYTIAFEGSTVYSDESFYDGTHDAQGKLKPICIHLSKIDDIVKRKALEVSMSRSDTGFTTWSKLKKDSSSQLQRYPSGNNNNNYNNNSNTSINIAARHAPHCFVRKSSSLPNLQIKANGSGTMQLHVSQAISTSTVDSYGKMRTLLPMFPMPLSQTSDSDSPAPLLQHSNSSNGPPQPNQPSFNLVKLFIKQKSSSTDTCMDVSSGCWPSDSSSSIEHRQRKKSMNDSGKGSALSRHDEDNEHDFQYDSLDVPVPGAHHDTATSKPANRSNDLYREVFDSPSHRNYKECNLNIRNYPKHQQVVSLNNINNNNNSMEKDSLKETNKSLSEDASRTSENITQVFTRNHVPIDVITRSIQTSVLLKDRVKVVPPSFLAQLNQNNKIGESKRAPVYVIYPNYALPNLDFVNQSDVILSPLDYKEVASPTVGGIAKTMPKKKRPVSLADVDEMLRKKQYKHVVDWKSLAPLLPLEYRKLLKHIPEVDASVDSILAQRPIFCMSPPIRRSRPVSCDCASYYTSSSGGSSSGHPPSSGFRGSSTMLTDSEFDGAAAAAANNNNDPMKNLYVYQYDNNSHMENESGLDRPPSGRTPRGILRRSNSKTKSKRNSMFEENNHQNAAHNLDKRRSLQEPYYASQTHNIIEDYLAELNDHDYMAHRLNNSRVYARNQAAPTQQFFDQTAIENHSKGSKTNLNYIMELNEEANRRMMAGDADLDARHRAEHFLSNVPKSDLKYYAEVANILESIDKSTEPYDRNKLRNEVSRALSLKKVSFNSTADCEGACGGIMTDTMTIASNMGNINNNNPNLLGTGGGGREFNTPPNSPNISITALRLEQKQKRCDQEKQDKIQSNRFKRLQIQWELLSKEANTLESELGKETRSGGSTPTSAASPAGAIKSKIPRPVSYPASKPTPPPATTKNLQSPSRLVPPKKYGASPVIGVTAAPSPRPRTPSKLHTTPKKTVTPVQRTTRCTR